MAHAMLKISIIGSMLLSTAFASTQKFDLRDPRSGENLYSGEDEVKDNIRVTRYFDKDHHEILKETLESTPDGKLKSFQSANTLTGESSSINGKNTGGFDVSYAPGKTEKPKVVQIKSDKDLFVPRSSADLILKNWATLMAGKPLKFDLILPTRMETVPFQLVHRETRKVDGESREIFTLFPQNVLIKNLAPNYEYQYSADKVLKQANFPSPLPVKGAKEKLVEASYTAGAK